jgi:hypothetical protein
MVALSGNQARGMAVGEFAVTQWALRKHDSGFNELLEVWMVADRGAAVSPRAARKAGTMERNALVGLRLW